VLDVCFIGGTRYRYPLDMTSEKKFRVLKSLGRLFVIGFSQDLRPRWFEERARLYLLPQLPLPILRYAEMFMLGALLVGWLIVRHGVQVLVAQSPYEGFAAAVAKKIAGWLGYKTVLVIESHGDFEESLFLQRRIRLPVIYRFLMRHVARFTLGYADLLRAISRSTTQQLGRWVQGKAIFQFPPWTDIEVFLQAGRNGGDCSSQNIIYGGVLTPLKGVHHLINAFAQVAKDFPQAGLVLIGREENKAYAVELKRQVMRLDLNGRVQFMGEMPQVELAAWLHRARVFVLPSTSEGLGRVVVEAMATGTPIIGSNVGGIPEMVENGTTGFLIQPGDEIALAERLQWILAHPDEAHEMGCRARVFAERFFSTKAYVQGYGQVFEVAQALLAGTGEHARSAL
jgi:glycosyltransferase involved in cell wall biosynthesis